MESQIKNILLVEDNPDHADLARIAFQGQSKENGDEFRVQVVKSGEECFQALSSESFNAVVMDYSLPRMDGLQVLVRMREGGIRTPVLMVTGRGDEKIAAEAIKKGASDYLVKDQGYLVRLPLVVRNSVEQFERLQEKEKLEEKLKNYQIELEISKRLASIGEMASRIAHEIKNPLSKIKMGVDFLTKHVQAAEASSGRVMAGILEGVDHLNQIAAELLNYAKPAAFNFQDIEIHGIIDAGLNDLSERIQRTRVVLVKDYGRDTKKLRVDGVKIKEVFLNLIQNALDAMPSGGKLLVKTVWKRTKEGRFLEICFTDTGEGIAEENLDKVCAPFFTTKPKGTGLGLSVVKKVMEAHRGDVAIQSREGKGTTVFLRLPDRKKR